MVNKIGDAVKKIKEAQDLLTAAAESSEGETQEELTSALFSLEKVQSILGEIAG